MIGGFMGFTGDRGTFCVSLKVSATGVAYIYICSGFSYMQCFVWA